MQIISDNKAIELNTLEKKISVNIRHSIRAKNISINIKRWKVELVLPYGTSEETGYKFLLSKESWVRKHLKNRKEPPTAETIHNKYLIIGKEYILKHIEAKSKFCVSIKEEEIIAHTPKTCLAYALTTFFKGKILNDIKYSCHQLAIEHGFNYKNIFVKELKSKWGSCSSAKNLTFNWRIIFAPMHVFNYLLVHELCHLKEMNHSKKFWKLVSEIFPDYKKSERWLKDHGHTLYHYLPTN